MGDPESVGLDLNKVLQAKPEWGIIGLTVLLAGVGFLVTALLGLESQYLVFVLGGIRIAGLLYFLDYRKLKAYSKHIFAGVCLVLFLAVLTELQGSTGSRITSNLAEFAPLLLIISLAGFMGNELFRGAYDACVADGMEGTESTVYSQCWQLATKRLRCIPWKSSGVRARHSLN